MGGSEVRQAGCAHEPEVQLELPLEEVFFLALLCYLTMNLVNGFSRLADHHVARARERANR